MQLHVLFAQRKCRYAGQYGLEALAAMTEHENSDNPEFLPSKRQELIATDAFEAVGIVTLDVDENAVRAKLFPSLNPISAQVIA